MLSPMQTNFTARRALHVIVLAMVMIGLSVVAAKLLAAEPADALPPGPKDVLATSIGEDVEALQQIVAATRSADEWLGFLADRAAGMDEQDVLILADYLAFNMPATDVATIGDLPPDGRELFLQNCFSCHGVSSYYLLQDRDAAGWMAIFDAPYHRRLLTEGKERETFSSYAAQAMPIAAEAIPEDWRD